MLVLKEMKWNNWFSYGEKNYIDFNSALLTQILGINGSGKSSIPLILEELLYGKNSKGIKKVDIPNRYTEGITSASLSFEVDGIPYEINLTRKSSVKISLLQGKKDISSHTSKGTYQTIEELIGLDFKTFNQLVYQSSKSSLEFLTATDTQRKNFLISLFNLERYSEYLNIFKTEHKDIQTELNKLMGSKSTIESWISKHKDFNFSELPLKVIPEKRSNSLLKELKDKLRNIDDINTNIKRNNINKTAFKKLEEPSIIEEPDADIIIDCAEKIAKLEVREKELNLLIKKIESLGNICYSCDQPVDAEHQKKKLDNAILELTNVKADLATLRIEKEKLSNEYKEYVKNSKDIVAYDKAKNLVKELPSDLLDESDLHTKIKAEEYLIEENQSKIKESTEYNNEAIIHNAKIQLISDQQKSNNDDLDKISNKIKIRNKSLKEMEILKKVFSTSGLVSYKIEFLIKDLEQAINKYLSELSDGRFQLIFILSGDKLNVDIIDDGKTISITALSSGELSRVNTATLLAIRSLMSSLSKTKINLLFLDEIFGVLDAEGKERLIDVLLEERDLNTFIVSHSYTHPLLDKIEVVKKHGVSNVQ